MRRRRTAPLTTKRGMPSIVVVVVVMLASWVGLPTAGVASTSPAAGANYSVLGALTELPAVSGYAHVGTADLTAFSDVFGVATPSSLDDPALDEWVHELISGNDLPIPIPVLFNRDRIATISEWGSAMGWTGFVDATSFVELRAGGRRAERSLTVITGDVDEHSFGTGVTALGDGVFTFGTGVDGEPVPGNTMFDPEGRPVRIAAKDGKIAASHYTAPVTWWLAGPDPSLADDGTMAAITDALDSNNVISAIIRRASFVFERYLPTEDYTATEAEVAAAIERTTVTEEFAAAAIGWTPDAPTTIVYAFADAASAAAALPQLESLYRDGEAYDGTKLSDRVDLQSLSVVDRLVVMTVIEQSPWEVWTLFFNGDSPFTFVVPT